MHPILRNAPMLAALATTGLVGACGGDDSADPAAPPTAAVVTATSATTTSAAATSDPTTTPVASSPTATTAPVTIIDIADPRLALTVALPDEHPVVNAGEHDYGFGPECMALYWQLAGGFDVEAWPAGCDPANSEPGNGEHGHYRSAADAPAPIDPIEIETGLGPAAVFGQTYYECTNSCTEWELDIAVIALSEPVDAEYPALTVIGTAEDTTRDDLLALLESFAAG